MASRSRRTQLIGFAVGIVVLYFLFFNGDYGNTDFRQTTETAIARKHGILRGDLSDEDLQAQTNRELQAILRAKERAIGSQTNAAGGRVLLQGSRTEKPTNRPYAQNIDGGGDEVSVAGRKTMPKQSPQESKETQMLRDKEKPRYPVDKTTAPGAGADSGEEVAFNGNKVEAASDPGEEMAREELQAILKKSPIIIFSKSYCPYSKRAKALLLETYTITPAPYVVELDLMTSKVPKPHHVEDGDDNDDDDTPAPTLGKKLQDLLASLSGRKTVPNIMINTQSLGGGDDVARMDADGTLIENIKKMGGKRIVSIDKKDAAD